MSYQKRRLYYKGMRLGTLGLPVLDNSDKVCRPEEGGRAKRSYHPSFLSPFKSNSSKNLIMMYDIPNKRKTERDWFRRQLVKFGFIMIQKSVWVGPSPLPKQFMDYLKEIGIKNKLKIFKLAKPYSGKSYII